VHKNIFVVGDDAQSIYKFRGSDITNILNFEQDYPEAKIIKLEQNYRSSKNILAIAQTVIDLNSEQKPKKLWTENAEGEKIILTCEADEQAEAEFVARKIVQLASGASSVNSADALTYETDYEQAEVKSYSILDRFIQAKKMQAQYSNAGLGGFIQQLPKVHDPLKEYCVLYRTHAQSRAVEEALIKASIPYQIIGGLKFYERKEIKDMLSYLRLVINFRDLVSLKRVINEPARGIGDKSYEVIRDFVLKHRDEESQKDSDGSDELRLKHYELNLKKFRQALSEIKLAPKQWQATQDFFKLIEELVLVSPDLLLSELMNRIFIRTGYEKYLQDGSEMGEARVENVKELINVTHKYAKMPWREAATEFLQEVALISEIDSKDENKDAVTLMTLHSAKGLEFDNVFFIGLEEGILPHSRSLMDMAEIAEEVRLAYVGLTRARKRLFLVYTHGRRVFGSFQNSTPSRILKVLPKEKLKLKGMAKDHFGEDEAENF
jgi:DNA helicase-2/ATP-dependent DNA helicase PcrA